jgi:putative membrane protein
MKTRTANIAATAFAFLLATTAFAQGNSQGNKPALSGSDREFAMKAAAGGMEEVEMGRLAVSKATDPDVKAFGQRMVDDHTKANDQLKSLASQKGLTLPAALPADMKKDLDKMSKLSGAEFDRMYMSMMLKDHKKDIAEFEKEASKGNDSSLKSFAQTTLPTLREHLTMAQTIAAKVGVKGDGTDHSGHSGKH